MSDDKIELNRRRVLGGLATIGVASAGAGAGTMAYFSDTEDSTGNTVQAGTIDLTGGSGSDQLEATDLAPGATVSKTWTLQNDGTIDGNHVEIAASYSENDGSDNEGTSVEKSADAVAKELELSVDHGSDGDVTSSVGDVNDDEGEPISLYDLAQNGLDDLEAPGTSGSVDTMIDLTLDSDVGNDFQNDGVDITFTFTLNQDISQ